MITVQSKKYGVFNCKPLETLWRCVRPRPTLPLGPQPVGRTAASVERPTTRCHSCTGCLASCPYLLLAVLWGGCKTVLL